MEYTLKLKNPKCEAEIRGRLSEEFGSKGAKIISWNKAESMFKLNLPATIVPAVESFVSDYNGDDQLGYNVLTLAEHTPAHS